MKCIANELFHCDEKLEDVAKTLLNARDNGKMIFTAGNGGSSASASHFCNDLVKGLSYGKEKRFKAIALCDSVPIITALANDVSYGDIFIEQLKNFASKDDVLLVLSGSGNSENIVKAARYAGAIGMKVIGFTGAGGGMVRDYCTICCMTKTGIMEQIEDIHSVWLHSLILRMKN